VGLQRREQEEAIGNETGSRGAKDDDVKGGNFRFCDRGDCLEKFLAMINLTRDTRIPLEYHHPAKLT
ncbi:hypothetical protein V1477_005276, partial [Vespula maculifrons]